MIILLIIIILIILRQLCSFHCNCFVCSMLDLIDSCSILIESCRCLPGKKKNYISFPHLYYLKTKKLLLFLIFEKTVETTTITNNPPLQLTCRKLNRGDFLSALLFEWTLLGCWFFLFLFSQPSHSCAS